MDISDIPCSVCGRTDDDLYGGMCAACSIITNSMEAVEDAFVRVGDFELSWDEADVLWGRVGLTKEAVK